MFRISGCTIISSQDSDDGDLDDVDDGNDDPECAII